MNYSREMTLQQQNMSLFGEGNFSLKDRVQKRRVVWQLESLQLVFLERWMNCTLKWLFSSTSIPIPAEILFALYVALPPNGVISNLNKVFLGIPLHLIFLRHFLTWYLLWQPFCMYKLLAHTLLIFSKIFSLFQSCCSVFHLTLLPPSVDI